MTLYINDFFLELMNIFRNICNFSFDVVTMTTVTICVLKPLSGELFLHDKDTYFYDLTKETHIGLSKENEK